MKGRVKMIIKKVTDVDFKKYGQVLKNYDCSEIIEKMKSSTPLPSDVIYEPSIKELEDLKNLYQFYYCLSSNLLIKKRSIHLPGGIKNKIQKAYKEFGIEKYPNFSFEECVIQDFENNTYIISNE